MINEQVAKIINQQVGHEFSAFLQYVAHSTWFESQAMPELARYFAKQADEERSHALKMIKFLNDTDQQVAIPSIPQPVCSFASVEEAVQLAHAQEKRVTDQIQAIYNTAAETNDRLTQNFLQWFLEEQVEEVAGMDSLLKVVRRAGSDMFRVEEYIAREGHPEDTAA